MLTVCVCTAYLLGVLPEVSAALSGMLPTKAATRVLTRQASNRCAHIARTSSLWQVVDVDQYEVVCVSPRNHFLVRRGRGRTCLERERAGAA